METIYIRNLKFAYPNQENYAIYDVSMDIKDGEITVLCGTSGSGKSTLLQLIREQMESKENLKVGYVFQEPEHQVVTDKVWHELSFGLENLRKSKEEIRLKVAEISGFFGISQWFEQKIDELSGGQKQLLNLASVMVMEPDILLLDEPMTQLDPVAAQNFLHMIDKIHRELGTTIVMCEHNLQEICTIADQVYVLDQGQVAANGTVETVICDLKKKQHFFYEAMPIVSRIALEVDGTCEKVPISIQEGKLWLNQKDTRNISKTNGKEIESPALFHGKNIWFRYHQEGKEILKDISVDIYQGEIFGILGGNGVGKTTLLGVLQGDLKAYRGKTTWTEENLEIGLLPQNPEIVFSKETVKEELLEMSEDVDEIIAFLELEDILFSHPYDISGGQKQRVALGKLLLRKPRILLLDEPTKGLDIYYQKKLAKIFERLTREGITIVLVSHDVEFCSRYTNRCAFMFQGRIMEVANPRVLFCKNRFYTTVASKMARHKIANAVLEEDVIKACKNTEEEPPFLYRKEAKKFEKKEKIRSEKSKGQQIWMYLWILLEVGTVLGSYLLFHNRHYYETCFLMLAMTLFIFLGSMELRKMGTREFVMIAVLIAFGVIGRCAFFMVPQFKPTIAMVMIAGMFMGNQTGFFVGAMTGFISNFMFGQGPWTPWQMLALGMIGLLSGSLRNKNEDTSWKILILGGIFTFFVYGGIVDVWTILRLHPIPTWQSAMAVYTLAIPFNLIHSISTILFLKVLRKPMLKKLNRVKLKYQMNF